MHKHMCHELGVAAAALEIEQWAGSPWLESKLLHPLTPTLPLFRSPLSGPHLQRPGHRQEAGTALPSGPMVPPVVGPCLSLNLLQPR